MPLVDIKEAVPVKVAEYAKANKIDKEPAFAWWVPYILKKRDIIISKVTSRIKKTTHKYGMEIPTTIEDAKRIDAENDNRLW